MDKTTKKATSFFQSNNQDLQFIFAKIRKLNEINNKVLGFIDPTLKQYCTVANLSGNKLVILTSNSSIATQLRFQSPDLLKKLQHDATLSHIKEIQVKVGMPNRPELRATALDKTPQKVAQLSPETAELILQLAEGLEDPKLREIMARIAGNTGTKW